MQWKHVHTVLRRARTVLACTAVVAMARAVPASLPPQPHWLEYRIAWNGIPAANATVEITPSEFAGQHSLAVEANVETNSFLSLFWPFRGTARTTLVGDHLTPLHFAFEREMAGTPYTTWIDFDADRAHSVYLRGDQRRDQELDGPDIIDPITAVFRARLGGAKAGDTLVYDVWTGEARFRVRLQVSGPEPVEVPAGKYSALRVVPEVWRVSQHTEPDTRLRQATIWVADDEARTLLRIRSEIVFGAVTIDLVKVEPAGNAARLAAN